MNYNELVTSIQYARAATSDMESDSLSPVLICCTGASWCKADGQWKPPSIHNSTLWKKYQNPNRELFTASIDVVYIADIADIASCQFYGAGATFEPQKQLELMKNSERRCYLSLYGIPEFHWCISIKGYKRGIAKKHLCKTDGYQDSTLYSDCVCSMSDPCNTQEHTFPAPLPEFWKSLAILLQVLDSTSKSLTSGVKGALLKLDGQDHTMLHSKSQSHHFLRLHVGPVLLEDLCPALGTAVTSLFGKDWNHVIRLHLSGCVWSGPWNDRTILIWRWCMVLYCRVPSVWFAIDDALAQWLQCIQRTTGTGMTWISDELSTRVI